MGTVEDLIRSLNSDIEKERAFAAEDIGYEYQVEGIVPLVKRLQVEPSQFVREVIVNTLKSIRSPQLVEEVAPLLRSDDAFIRNAAIDILSCQDETALDSIRFLLHDKNKDVRKFALDVAFRIKCGHSAALVAEALDDPDVNIVITAVEYLGQLESAAFTDQVNRVFTRTDNILLCCTCLETLAVIGNEQSVECVARRYPDYQSISALEQYSYLNFVAHKGNEAQLPLVLSLMQEKGHLMAKEIINAVQGILQRTGWDRLPPELFSGLVGFMDNHLNDINKYEMLVWMGKFKNDEIYPLLLSHLDVSNKLVCLGAVEGLGLYGRPEARRILKDLELRTPDEDILEAIKRSLEQLG